ncbi:hypothetical protein ACIP5Y_31800 [Nocardia sp. NPDC088792]|uniref:hypothetical protein n=1 Tax=Nocardia sp. NPDC088792 TaxID=3364332 RepID=UPI00380DCB7F
MPKWLVSAGALKLLADAGMSQAELSADFDTPSTYLVAGTQGSDDYSNAVRTQTFTSVDALRSAVERGLDPATQAVLYDNEAWPLTPTAEQQDPAAAETRAAAVAHAHHLLLIATPATDLTRILAPGENSYDAYLRLGISAAAAKAADVIDIQAQGSEADTSRYADFVKQAAAAARTANPKVVVLAGISTNPSGQSVTADQVGAAIDATRSFVDGYWLNVPQAGNACPRCGTAQPQVAVGLLRNMNSH